jgi:ABC-type lipoprotein release transport system permease subunit
MPPELLHDIIQRVEASQTTWPTRRDVVACALVCRSWRKITKEIVKTPEQCGSLTFPISLKQVIFFFLFGIPLLFFLYSTIYPVKVVVFLNIF